jgi:hypothetical protein
MSPKPEPLPPLDDAYTYDKELTLIRELQRTWAPAIIAAGVVGGAVTDGLAAIAVDTLVQRDQRGAA